MLAPVQLPESMWPDLDNSNSRCRGPNEGCCSAQRRFSRSAKSRSKTFCVRSKTASSFSAANSFSASVSWPLSLSSLTYCCCRAITPRPHSTWARAKARRSSMVGMAITRCPIYPSSRCAVSLPHRLRRIRYLSSVAGPHTPPKRTCAAQLGMSAKCQKRTSSTRSPIGACAISHTTCRD